MRVPAGFERSGKAVKSCLRDVRRIRDKEHLIILRQIIDERAAVILIKAASLL